MKLTKSAVIYADGHVKHATWAERPFITGDSVAALDEIVTLCIATEASLVIAGDVFDSKRIDADVYMRLYTRLEQMRSAGLPVYAIHGNHDCGATTWMSVLPSDLVTYVDLKFFEPAEGVRMFGIGYRKPDELREVLANLPADAHTLLMHQCVKQILPFQSFNLDLDWVPAQVKQIVIGDMHAPLELVHNGISVVSPGSPHITEITANLDRSAVVISAQGMQRVPLFRRAVAHVTVYPGSEDTADAFLALCRTAVTEAVAHKMSAKAMTPILHVRIPSDLGLQYAPALDVFRMEYPVIKWVDIYPLTDVEVQEDMTMPSIGNNVVVDFRALLDEMEGEADAKEMAWALLTTVDRQQVFESERKKALEG